MDTTTISSPPAAARHPADPKVTTSTGQDYIDRHTAVLAKAFATDPVFTYMLSSLTSERRAAYLPEYMHTLLRGSMLNAGDFVEADDWSCAAVWMPPGRRVDNEFTIIQAGFLGLLWNIGASGCRKMFTEFNPQAGRVKAENLVDLKTGAKLKRFHYLWFIGTAEEARGRGLASSLVKRKQEEVRKGGEGERLPIWLEATTEGSRRVYQNCGFKVVGEIKLGIGTHASTGLPEKGGSGLVMWGMIWRPEWNGEKEGKGYAVAGPDREG